jgi:hypothetical protein
LRNVYLQITPKYYHSWPAEATSSDLDIVLNSETNIEPIKNENRAPAIPTLKEKKSNEHQSSTKKRLPNSSSNLNMNENAIDEKRLCIDIKDESLTKQNDESSPLVLRSASSNSSGIEFEFTPLNMLPIVEPKTVVNVYGIITKTSNVNQYVRFNDMSECELKHIYIKDNSKIETRCAFWGKQAVNFTYKEGTVVLLRDVEVTRFDGITLNVLRTSGVIEITSNYNYSFYNDLMKMYLNEWKN